MKRIEAIFLLCVTVGLLLPASAQTNSGNSAKTEARAEPVVPAAWYQKVRNYGPWDYKRQSYQYRDFTLFNFGATGGAAGVDKDTLIHLGETSKSGDPAPPSEEDLQENFTNNAETFDKLRQISEEDAHVIRIAKDFTWTDMETKWPRDNVGFSEERWAVYRDIFQKLGLGEGIARSQDYPATVFFVAGARGLCTGGAADGYAFSTESPSPVVKSLRDGLMTEMQKSSKHYVIVLKRLKPNWYLFYQADR